MTTTTAGAPGTAGSPPLRHAVVVVSWRRPDHVRACLQALYAGERVPDEVVVVDASDDDLTERATAEFPSARYVRFAGGAGHMTTARNEGLRHVSADVVSFLDDDVQAGRGWSAALVRRFGADDVAAVAGRTRNGDPGEESEGVDRIGRLLPDATLTGFFAADPGRVVEVDHGIGANMSFRREWLARLGGFRDVFPGTAMREDTDVFLRVRALGGRVVFDPHAVVDNTSAPHVKGRRFDLRYAWYAERNHVQLLGMNFGLGSRQVRRYLRHVLRTLATSDRERRPASRLVRAVARLAAIPVGAAAVARLGTSGPLPAERRDGLGDQLRSALGRAA